MESLDRNICALERVHPGTPADLDALPYIANSLKQLQSGPAQLPSPERTAAETEINTLQQAATALNANVRASKTTRTAAQRAFIANLK